MNPAYLVIAVCSCVLAAVVAVALLAGQLLTRRACAVGLLCHGSLVALIGFGAYMGMLPDWFQGKGVMHYHTFLHFYMVGLLAFLFEGALILPPVRFAGID